MEVSPPSEPFYYDAVQPRKPYEVEIKKLQCHFNWLHRCKIPEEEVQDIITNLTRDVEVKCELSLSALALLAYLYTIESRDKNLEEAFKYIAKAEEICRSDSDCGKCHWVIFANRIHIDLLRGEKNPPLLEDLRLAWKHKEHFPLYDAGAWGCKAMALGMLGKEYHERAIDSYKRASALDPDNVVWIYEQAALIGQHRREVKGIRHWPSQEEESLWKDALERKPDCPKLQIGYAFVLAEVVKTKPPHLKQKHVAARRNLATEYCLDALDSAENNDVIYEKCARVFQWFKMFNEFENCVTKGARNCKFNKKLLHMRGLYFWRHLEEFTIAMADLSEALGNDDISENNFGIAFDLLKIKMQINPSFDPREDFKKLEKILNTASHKSVHKDTFYLEFGMYLVKTGSRKAGLDYLVKAVEIEETRQSTVLKPFCRFKKKIEHFLLERIDSLTYADHIMDLASFYSKLKPHDQENDEKAVNKYEEVLALEPNNNECLLHISKVFFKMGDYRSCLFHLDRTDKNNKHVSRLREETLLRLRQINVPSNG